MTQFSKSLILSVACASILAACAESQRTQASKAITAAASQKAEVPTIVVAKAKFAMIPVIEAEVAVEGEKKPTETVENGVDLPKPKKTQAQAIITLPDPEDNTKAVILSKDGLRFNSLSSRVTMTAKNQSQSVESTVLAQCIDVRGEICDTVLAVIVQKTAAGTTKKDVVYFQRTVPEGAKIEELVKTADFNNKELEIVHSELDRSESEEMLFQKAHLAVAGLRLSGKLLTIKN